MGFRVMRIACSGVFACMTLSVIADQVSLDNGSTLVGTVQSVKDGTVVLATDFAGTLTLDLARVTSMSTEAPMFVALQSGNRLYGTMTHGPEGTRVETPDGTMTVKEGSLVAAWEKGEADPTLPAPPKPREWTYEAFVDVNGKTGNSERFRLGGGAKAILLGSDDRLMLYARGARAEEDGETSEDEIVGGIDFEQRIKGKHSWYARTELEQDEIDRLDLRTTAALGYGYYFLDRADWKLRLRTGLQYEHESYTNGSDNSSVGADLGLHHMLKLGDWARLLTDVTYTPAFGDFADYRLSHQSSIDLPLSGSKLWTLRLGVSNEYSSEVPPNTEELDTTYFARLVLSWD